MIKHRDMNRLIGLAALLLSFCPLYATAQTWQWAEQGTGMHNEYAGDIDIDAAGNSYVTGKFYNTVSFGAYTLNSPGTWAIYIAKYDVNGSLLWARIAAVAAKIKVTGICTDQSGAISVTGLYSDSASFGDISPVPVYAVAGYDIFLARYTATGALIWVRSAGDQGYDYSSSVSHDAVGNLFITGEFHISAYTGSAAKVFVARYDSSGNNAWFTIAQRYGNFHQGNDLKTSDDGTSYVTGQFFDTLFFDSSTALGAGNIEANIFILKVDSSGGIVWMQKAGSAAGYTSGNAIDIDAAGNAYITGFYRGTVTFGTLSLDGPAGISYDVYIAKCNTNGDFAWVNKATGPWALDNAMCLATDNMGSVYIAGNFQDSITLGNTTVYSPGQSDVFLGKADALGNFVWAGECGGPAYDDVAGIKANALGLFLTGDFKSTGQFGPLLTLNADSSDIFTARIYDSPEGIQVPQKQKDITLFPDPAAGFISLSGTVPAGPYTIYDVSGRALLSGNTAMPCRIDISSLHTGMYYLRLPGAGGQQVLKFIKE